MAEQKKIVKNKPCPHCRGSGYEPVRRQGQRQRTCGRCHGAAVIPIEEKR